MIADVFKDGRLRDWNRNTTSRADFIQSQHTSRSCGVGKLPRRILGDVVVDGNLAGRAIRVGDFDEGQQLGTVLKECFLIRASRAPFGTVKDHARSVQFFGELHQVRDAFALGLANDR